MGAEGMAKGLGSAGDLSKAASSGGSKAAGSSGLPDVAPNKATEMGAGGSMQVPTNKEQGGQAPGDVGGNKASATKMAGAAAAVPAAGVAANALFLASFVAWLKTMFMAAMAMIANFVSMLVGFITGVASAVVGGVTAAISAISSALGVSQMVAAFSFFLAAASTAVAGVAGVSAANNENEQTAMRNDPLAVCSDAVQASVDSAGSLDPVDTDAQTDANAERIYQIFSGAGMADENIAGILGNWTAESGIDPTGVETIYDEKFQIGPKKQHAIDVGFDISQVDAGYAARFPAIDKMGIGLGQWTNGRNTLLTDYADSINKDWHELDTQLGFMLNADDPTRVQYMKDMIESPAGSPEEATLDFMHNWEGISDGSTSARVSAANSYFAKMSSWEGDEALADSILGQVGTGTGGANTKSVSNAAGECMTEQSANADNSSLVMAMLSYSWPTIDQSRGNDGTALYQELHEKIFPGDPYFMSCDRGVATAVRWSGSDDTYPAGPVSEQLSYLATSDKWKEITDWGGNPDNLQPGDILLRKDGQVSHTIMYTGKELVQQHFGSKAAPDSQVSHASLNTRSPGIGTWDSRDDRGYGTYTVYRNVKPEADSKYKDIVPSAGTEFENGGGQGSGKATGDYIMPVSAPITSPYGYRIHPISGTRKLHGGTDFGAACGTPIKAADGGVVTFSGMKGASGNRVDIDHGNGITTGYFHQSSISVKVGDKVDQGQVIGYVGTTGSSTGCHLHFTAAKGGSYFDPMTLY